MFRGRNVGKMDCFPPEFTRKDLEPAGNIQEIRQFPTEIAISGTIGRIQERIPPELHRNYGGTVYNSPFFCRKCHFPQIRQDSVPTNVNMHNGNLQIGTFMLFALGINAHRRSCMPYKCSQHTTLRMHA